MLRVQRFTLGGWQDSPVTVLGERLHLLHLRGVSQPGVNRFRVVDTDTGKTSNEVRVRVR